MAADTTPAPTLSTVTLVKKNELCRLVGVSDQTISNYAKAGLPISNGGKGAGARYNLSECIAWIRDYEVQKALKSKQKPEQEDAAELERRKLIAQVEREEYQTAKLLGALVSIEDVAKEWAQADERLRAKLTAVPAVWGPQLLGLKEIPDAVDRLADLVHNLMTDLATFSDGEDDEDDESDVAIPEASSRNASEDDA